MTANRGTSTVRDNNNIERLLVTPPYKLHYRSTLRSMDPILGKKLDLSSLVLKWIWAKLEASRVTLPYGGALNLIFAQLDVTTPSEDIRSDLQTFYKNFSSLNQRLTCIEKYHASSSRGDDPMDTSLAPQSDDEDTEEGSDEGEEEESEGGEREEEECEEE
ncbi:uncharacterized protein LOC131158562 [Malania oleifera]|uniref:uncharacterized protein LOC131158562 n=1 Tax=Malania oleifera TaxID=397392 RepID=UPI0025ADA5B4|nr:uncharacterized protein LOC131158562 [Malania oleifera]